MKHINVNQHINLQPRDTNQMRKSLTRALILSLVVMSGLSIAASFLNQPSVPSGVGLALVSPIGGTPITPETPVPPTKVPPTKVPPTDIPPTDAPPTDVPPRRIPPSPIPIPCYRAKFVEDVTIPDGMSLTANTPFTKTWRLQNVGACIWDSSFQIVFVGGTSMAQTEVFPWIGGVVRYGQSVDISVDLYAPNTDGKYQSDFRLLAPDGTIFGLGVENKAFWVRIEVPVSNTSTPIPPTTLPTTTPSMLLADTSTPPPTNTALMSATQIPTSPSGQYNCIPSLALFISLFAGFGALAKIVSIRIL